MVDRRLCLALLAVTLFVTVLHAERARNDHREDDGEAEEEEQDLASDNNRYDAEGRYYLNCSMTIVLFD